VKIKTGSHGGGRHKCGGSLETRPIPRGRYCKRMMRGERLTPEKTTIQNPLRETGRNCSRYRIQRGLSGGEKGGEKHIQLSVRKLSPETLQSSTIRLGQGKMGQGRGLGYGTGSHSKAGSMNDGVGQREKKVLATKGESSRHEEDWGEGIQPFGSLWVETSHVVMGPVFGGQPREHS